MAKTPSDFRRKVSALAVLAVAVGWLCAFGGWLMPPNLLPLKVALLTVARVLP
jgi:fatty acid desaturase